MYVHQRFRGRARLGGAITVKNHLVLTPSSF